MNNTYIVSVAEKENIQFFIWNDQNLYSQMEGLENFGMGYSGKLDVSQYMNYLTQSYPNREIKLISIIDITFRNDMQYVMDSFNVIKKHETILDTETYKITLLRGAKVFSAFSIEPKQVITSVYSYEFIPNCIWPIKNEEKHINKYKYFDI